MIATPRGPHESGLTALGELLAKDGEVTTDEYLHFLAQATTQPSPALSGWNHTARLRYPLLFALRFILARAAQHQPVTDIAGIVDGYVQSGFVGDETAPLAGLSRRPRVTALTSPTRVRHGGCTVMPAENSPPTVLGEGNEKGRQIVRWSSSPV